MRELETVESEITITGVFIKTQGNGLVITHWLHDGESVMVGSDEQCRVRIVDPSVSERQCLISLRAGKIFVHDWASEHPTLVNGEPADASIALSLTDRVTFGAFGLEFDTNDVTTAPNESLADASQLVESAALPVIDDGWDELITEDMDSTVEPLPDASVELSTIQMLTAEVETLQAELSEKDDIIAELSRGNHLGSVDDGTSGSNKELEQRIELLLFELDQSDQRVSAMEEVMRLSEEAHEAELEEKRQLETWVNDIEDRLAAREQEVSAECEVLRKRLENSQQDRKQVEGQISELIDDAGTDDALGGMVQVLRHENEQLRSKLEEKSLQTETCEKELEELRRNSTEEAVQQRVDHALRVERLQLAQERAALSRQQLEMSEKINELEQQIDKRARLNPADERFRAFREQLKELHEKEKREYVAPSLTERLANVWRKLDGPTDKD